MPPSELHLEGRLLLGRQLVDPGVILVGGGRVLWSGPCDQAPRLRPRRRRHAAASLIVPGYVDLHVHGGGGADALDGTAASLDRLRQVHLRHGTVALCPTVLSAAPAAMHRALEAIRAATRAGATSHPPRREDAGARLLGAHLEGPFLNPAHAGAQPTTHLRAPDPVLLEELLDAGGEALRLITLAPELPGALGLIERLVERGVVVSLGHSAATYAEAATAIDAGARLATHVCNAMAPLHHREPGLLGAVLLDPRVTVEVIADGRHLAAPTLQLIRRLKGRGRLALISDCTAALDAPATRARLGTQRVVVRDGGVHLPGGGLAGSMLAMDRAVANLVGLGGASLDEAVGAAARVPLRVLGARGRGVGTLQAGARADFLLLGPDLAPRAVFLDGHQVVGAPEDDW